MYKKTKALNAHSKALNETFKGYERNFQRLKRTFTLWTSKNSMIRTS